MKYDVSDLIDYASETSGYLIPCLNDDGSVDLHAKSYCGDTLVHAAVGMNDCEGIKFLHDYGLDINARGDYLATPLFQAAESNYVGMVKLLLELGADPAIPNNYGFLPSGDILKLAQQAMQGNQQ